MRTAKGLKTEVADLYVTKNSYFECFFFLLVNGINTSERWDEFRGNEWSLGQLSDSPICQHLFAGGHDVFLGVAVGDFS